MSAKYSLSFWFSAQFSNFKWILIVNSELSLVFNLTHGPER